VNVKNEESSGRISGQWTLGYCLIHLYDGLRRFLKIEPDATGNDPYHYGDSLYSVQPRLYSFDEPGFHWIR
jgi:hypothetical protein